MADSFSFTINDEGYSSFAQRVPTNARVAFEATGMSYPVFRALKLRGYEDITVAHPKDLVWIVESKKKNDRVDILKIAKIHMAGMLPESHLLTKEEQISRDLLVKRVKLGVEISRIKNSITSFRVLLHPHTIFLLDSYFLMLYAHSSMLVIGVRGRGFKLSKDPKFNEKVRDIVGLYMNPPEKAVVICLDEKAAIQALDRSQTMLPLRTGMPASTSYTYTRNGTIDLFAAINIIDGTVVTQLLKRHRHVEFLSFLRAIDESVPEDLQVDVVLDNLSTHDVSGWVERHPNFQFHFTPSGTSWLNMVEVWLVILTKRAD